MSDRLEILLRYLLPKRRLTSFAGRATGARRGALTARLIRWFVNNHGVDMSEAADADLGRYESFNDFFTRPLKAGARRCRTRWRRMCHGRPLRERAEALSRRPEFHDRREL